MASVLIVGAPGSGKSSVAAELLRRGQRSVDADYGLARWEDPQGTPAEFPAGPDMRWLRYHRWRWIHEPLEQVLQECHHRSAALCGTASNMADYLPRFDLLILLQIDEATMVRRPKDLERANELGKYGATLEWSLDWRPRLEAEMLEAGACPVDGQQPLANVVDGVHRLCTACSIDLSQN